MRVGADPGWRDHADPGDHRAFLAHAASLNRLNTIADWKPPKPLPTDNATSTRASRAVFGV